MNKDFFLTSGCCECDSKKQIVLHENKCQFVFANIDEKEIYKIRIDDCVIRDGKRCDFLVIYPENHIAFFVELKGRDLLHAVDQINRSIDLLIRYLDHTSIHVRIVLTKVYAPDLMNSPTLLKFEKRIKQLNGTFQKGTIKMCERI